MLRRLMLLCFRVVLVAALFGLSGCKNLCLTEINGKTSAGPQIHNFGSNTHATKYYAIQNLEFKFSNKWTFGVMYQRADIDDGAGDNENLLLFELGYPLWNAPKKPVKTAEELQIEGLERELRLLNVELAAAEQGTPGSAGNALVQAGKVE